ncbi:UNVERIFIED_CONTAM: hypothetical protein GTU68_044360 [Idotea baltica]|nr:hypothetical protein [Idotea baltica]
MSISLTILGCHSATPRTFAHPTSQYLEINNRRFLIDCGEGTQVQLRKYKIKFSTITDVFISHLHGDHYFGLIGLISTFGLLNRQNDLNIYAPKGLKEIINLQLKTSNSWPQFTINFHELNSSKSELIFEDDKTEVYTIPLEHRVYTNGFLFKEKLVCDYQNLKNGKDFIEADGHVITNEKLTFSPNKPLSYAFCSDTVFKPDIASIIKDVDLLYHESTFLKDRQEIALKTKHSTAEEAGKIAKLANAKQLILGHFSSRYDNLNLFKQEALSVFNNVIVAKEGKTIKIDSKVPNKLIVSSLN